jgi:putative transposase
MGDLNEDMKTILENITNNSDFNIEVMESDINHIHFLIRYIPRLSVSSIVRKLKQESTKQIWSLYSDILSQEFWLEKTFWSDGYFTCSIGEASPDTIREYILNQG